MLDDLIPVTHSMKAEKSASIRIDGSILLTLEGQNPGNRKHCAAVMLYVSPDAKAINYLKRPLSSLKLSRRISLKIGSAPAKHEVCEVTGKVDTADSKFTELGYRKHHYLL